MSLLDLIYPKVCLGCGKLGTYCCPSCLVAMPSLPFLKCPECERPTNGGKTHAKCQKQYGLDGIISLYPYIGVVKKVIKGMKYRSAFHMGKDLFFSIPHNHIHKLRTYIKGKHTFFVPIPLHPSRQRVRGFNQAAMIAALFSNALSLPTKDVLRRIRKTLPQVDMKSRIERLQNMEQVFAMKQGHEESVQGATIFLVDDVYTTGATLKSAANVLKKHGARIVYGLTIAQ